METGSSQRPVGAASDEGGREDRGGKGKGCKGKSNRGGRGGPGGPGGEGGGDGAERSERGPIGAGRRGDPADQGDRGDRGGKGKGGKGGKGGKSGKGSRDDRGEGGHRGERGERGERGDHDDRGGHGDRGDRGDRGERGGKGGKGGKGGSRPCRALPLGNPVLASLPGSPPGSGAPETCLLCCAPAPSYVAIGRCQHTEVCWVCILRLRALSQDKRCPVCKEESSEVFITSDASSGFPGASALAALPEDRSLGVRFADASVEKEVMRLFEYRCRVQKCAARSSAFGSLRELENHLWHAHWLQFCQTCLHGRSAFLREQCVFSSRDLDTHMKQGSSTQGAAGSAPPVPPHPLCLFCEKRYFDDDDLARHMHERHHLCQICAQMGRRNEFFANVRCLAAHYAEDHWVCAHPSCSHNGHRITAFSTEEELQLHMLKEHTDKTQGSDREKRELMQRHLMVGQRSYAQERAATAQGAGGGGKGGGKGRGANTTNEGFDIRFSWPGRTSRASLSNSEEEELARQLDEREAARRYPDRPPQEDEAPSQPRGAPVGSRAPRRGSGGGAGGSGEEEEGNEAGDDEAKEEEEDGEGEECEVEAEDEEDGVDERVPSKPTAARAPQGDLEPEVEALPLDVTVAAVGRQPGMRCCLDALLAVLRALRAGGEADDDRGPELRAAVGRLSLVDIESLERVRKDLDSGALSAECDWEPLERVLSLRPLFFRLLRSSRGGGGGKGAKIGPSAIGPKPAQQDDSEASWRTWRVAAQAAVLALGARERRRLWLYVELCARRRQELCNLGLDGPEDGPQQYPSLGGGAGGPPTPAGDTHAVGQPAGAEGMGAASFPSLGGGAATGGLRDGPGAGWGKAGAARPKGQDFPSLGPGAAAPAPAPAPKPKAFAMAAEAFPGLGGPAAGAAATSGWGAQAKGRAAAPVAEAAEPPKASGKPAAQKPKEFQGMGVAAFPGLGGPAKGVASGAAEPKWGARSAQPDSLRSAEPPRPEKPPEPELPKEFKGIQAGAFPDLPMGAPKPKTSAAKAGVAAAAKAAAAKAAAQRAKAAASSSAAAPVPSSWEDESPSAAQEEQKDDEELVVIHNPLDAVAASEQLNAARKTGGKKKQGSSRAGTRLNLNSWAEGPPTR